MTTETMNVHQALSELKMLDKRIEAAVSGTTWVVANKHSNTKVAGIPVKEWAEQVKSEWQKLNDLILRRDALKRAVVNSNAVTPVVVAGKTYTVAEAIDRKNNGIPLLEKQLNRLAYCYTRAKNAVEAENGDSLERRANDYVKNIIGNSDMKGATGEAQRIRAEFIEAQSMEILDPIGYRKELDRLREEIDGFMTSVDAVLSTSNAVTMISVEY